MTSACVIYIHICIYIAINDVCPSVVHAGVQAISAGSWRHSMMLKPDGSVWATGSNIYGQLSDGTKTDRSSYAMMGSTGQCGTIVQPDASSCTLTRTPVTTHTGSPSPNRPFTHAYPLRCRCVCVCVCVCVCAYPRI